MPDVNPHSHSQAETEDRCLGLALAITALFMLVEMAGGLISGSLALLADAGHMATDTAALTLALWASRRARTPADRAHTYGHRRQRVIAAFVNGLALLLLAAWILFEAIRRLLAPPEILGDLMLAVAAAGLVANIATLRILHHATADLNVRAAAAHVTGDLIGSVAAIIAATVIMSTGWKPIDPLLSILVAALIVNSGWHYVRETWHVLLEGAPPDFDLHALENELPLAVTGVIGVHHVHAWILSPDKPCLLTLHARLHVDTDADTALRGVREFVRERFGIEHVTVQLEREYCTDE